MVSFSNCLCCAPTGGVAVRQLTGGLTGSCHFSSWPAWSHFQRQFLHLWALHLFLFNQNTWKGHSVCFSPCISLTDAMIKFALPMWAPKLTAVASGNSWTQERPTDSKERRATPSRPLFLQRKLESHTPVLSLTRAGGWSRLASSWSHYVHDHQVPWQDCPALDCKIYENSIIMPGAR